MHSRKCNVTLTTREKILYHQIHSLKLATDILTEPLSLYFFWKHNLTVGLLTHFVPPILATILVIRFANLERLKNSKVGTYLLHNMTRPIEALRLAADIAMVFAAWFHSPLFIALPAVVILLAWSFVLLHKPPR
jgi:hypothetical protein